MIDVLTLVFIILIGLALVVANIYLLAYYCHPDDKGLGSAFICKVVVILGMMLAWSQVLMLPLDVSNNRSFGGGIDMKLFWFIVYIATAVFVLVIIPTLTAFYEADPEWSCWQKFKYCFCCFLCVVIVLSVICVVLYAVIGTAYIPVKSTNCSISFLESSNRPISFDPKTKCMHTSTELAIDVSFPIYIIALMSFISWFLFVLFGGIGLAALPLDFFFDFCTRPKHLTGPEIEERKKKLADNSEELKLLGASLKEMEEKGVKAIFSGKKRNYNNQLRKFKAGVHICEREFYIVNIADEMNKKNSCYLCLYYLLIPLGFICLLLSFAWIAQIICTFVIMKEGKPIYPLISNMFLALQDNNAAFLSFGLFSFFCLYLLWATMKGNLKFGMRVFLCWDVHPMKKNETYMNSFLFNVSLVLLCSVSVTQFCAASFPDYVTFTDIDLIFSVQIRYLVFFVYFYKYHVFEYALLGFWFLATVFLLCRPRDQVTVEDMYEKREADGKNDVLKSFDNTPSMELSKK